MTLVGHSLGTAVVTAVLEKMLSEKPGVDFAGLVLISGFSDMPNLMKTYMIGGVVPVLSPLRPYPKIEKFISGRILDTWDTVSRLSKAASMGKQMRVHLIHARNDYDIGWKHSDLLFDAAVQGMRSTADGGAGHAVPKRGLLEDGNMGRMWSVDKHCYVKQTVLRHGGAYMGCRASQHGTHLWLGHNRVISFAPVALAIRSLFEAAAAGSVSS